jgi:hypothetical protein
VYATRKTPPVNPYEDEGRAVKVQKLSDAIDSTARAVGLDPTSAVFAEMIARARSHAQVWWNLARTAGVRPPSDKTIAQLIAVYRERAARSQRSAIRRRVLGAAVKCPECSGAGRFYPEDPESMRPGETCERCDGEGNLCSICEEPLPDARGDVCAFCIADEKHGVAAEVRS